MKIIISTILCSVIEALAIMNSCTNDGSGTLSSCQSNSNIRIEKIREGNIIKHYRLSLHSQNIWWAAENEWINCGDLCEVCKSLPGINNGEKNMADYG